MYLYTEIENNRRETYMCKINPTINNLQLF